jgi:hypothetical protein
MSVGANVGLVEVRSGIAELFRKVRESRNSDAVEGCDGLARR